VISQAIDSNLACSGLGANHRTKAVTTNVVRAEKLRRLESLEDALDGVKSAMATMFTICHL